MKSHLLLVACLFLSYSIIGQSLWYDTPSNRKNAPQKQRITFPKEFKTISLNIESFESATSEVPLRTEANLNKKEVFLDIPLPDGKLQKFRLYDAELMHPDLAAKFPELKAYIGKGIDDPTADLRISYSPYHGFNGMIKSGNHSTVYIDPISTDHQDYWVYYRKDTENQDHSFECFTDETGVQGKMEEQDHNHEHPQNFLGDCNLRRYRLAQSCTGEYAQYHIGQAGGTTGTVAGDKAIVQSAMNVTMIRVNGVYEIDLGITMQFIANNDLIIYLDGGTDPWNGEWNTTTAETIDAEIGVANYDIGHNFNTTGGGNAGCLDCVCLSVNQGGTHKGRGYTGRAAPIGDPFDIDYVAHEMGHQFGGYHTQSNSSCRSGNGSTEVEPGSASTIMGYAGICPANVQSNSDDYFVYANIRDIVTTINGGNGSGCAELIPSGNSSPTADAGADYSIPVSTPFKLEGVGTDPNDSGLTFCWEQNDPENHGNNNAPDPNRAVGPMFRSLDPVSVPYRYMPNLNDVLNNVSPTWEVLPAISRDMEFAFTVRDNNMNSGCTETDLMTISTVAGVGPFLVTAPNTAVTWDVGTPETITWDVAGTDAAPINCSSVDILLSTDGGMTYPVTLASAVPNDGSHPITVPNNPGTNTRVMIFCSNNIFFDISNQDFTIQVTSPGFVLSSAPSSETACMPNTADYTITVDGYGGYSDDVTLSAMGLPAGMNASFSTNPVTSGDGTTILSLTTTGVAPGTYNVTVQGIGSTGTQTTPVEITVYSGIPGMATLTSPANGSVGVSSSPTFSWTAVTEAENYQIEIASNPDFTNIIETASGITGTTYTSNSNLNYNTIYYWRIRANNFCGLGDYSLASVFKVENIICSTYTSANVPLVISTTGKPLVTSTLNIPDAGTILDVNLVDLVIDHTYINDIHIDLTSPANTTVRVMDQSCGAQNNLDMNLDDQAAPGDWPCPPTGGGTYQPSNPLSAFNGENFNGTWTLEVKDNAAQDGGSLNNWAVEVCMVGPNICEAPLLIPTAIGTYTADMECTDAAGWTHYWKQAATAPATPTDVLLLSVMKDATVQILPNEVTVGVTGVGGAIDLSAAAYVTNPDGWFVMNRYWNVNPTAQPGAGGVDVRFYYTTADYDGVAAAVAGAGGTISSHSDLLFYKFQSGSGVNPDPSAGHVGGDATNYIEFTGGYSLYNLDHFAEFNVAGFSGGGGGAGGDGGSALPIELLDFSGKHVMNRWNELKWSTVSEQNSKHFEIQRSFNNRDFEGIGNVAAAGESSSIIQYHFNDEGFRTGSNYYRLKMVDLDGSFEYSNVIEIRIKGEQQISVMPNPTKGQFQIIFDNEVSGKIRINVLDATGREVLDVQEDVNNLKTKDIDLAAMAEGVYLIRVEIADQLFTSKVVKY